MSYMLLFAYDIRISSAYAITLYFSCSSRKAGSIAAANINDESGSPYATPEESDPENMLFLA